MKIFIAIAAAVLTATLLNASASYSVEVSMTTSKNENQYDFAAVVSEMVEEDGDVHEKTIAKPRVITTPGSPGSFYVGSCAEPDSHSISMEVTWPNYEEHGVVVCTVTVKRGERVVARSRIKATMTDQ